MQLSDEEPRFLEWDISLLAKALRISEQDTTHYFKDGRRISFLIERRLRDSFSGWSLAKSEGAGHDLVDAEGNCWEVRSVTKSIYFCPSNMVGKGRSFEKKGFLRKLSNLEGYICCDVTLFPKMPVFFVPADLIRQLYRKGLLGMNSSVTRANFYTRIVPNLNALHRVGMPNRPNRE